MRRSIGATYRSISYSGTDSNSMGLTPRSLLEESQAAAFSIGKS
ncbi:MAG: hypothetical protein ACRC62_06530 [Microcoleus sp.]